jgi:hypothetical protein
MTEWLIDGEKLMEWELQKKNEVFTEIPPNPHLVH